MNGLNLSQSPYADFMHEGKATIGDLTLHFEVGGATDAPTILLIMGLGAQMLIWPDAFCKALVDAGYRVIRFDNRDIGLSSKIRHKGPRLGYLKLMGRFSLGLPNSGSPYTLHEMADDTHLLIKALGLSSVHVIGASMGGMIAQILAAKHPEQVKSLNLLFTSNNRALLPPPFPKQLLSLIGRPKSMDEAGVIAHATRLYQTIGTPGEVNIEESKATAHKLFHRSFHPAGVVQQYLAILCTGSLTEIDRRISAPTLVVHGSKDKLLPPAHGRAVAKAIRGARFELMEGMGHDIPKAYIPRLVAAFSSNIMSFEQTATRAS